MWQKDKNCCKQERSDKIKTLSKTLKNSLQNSSSHIYNWFIRFFFAKCEKLSWEFRLNFSSKDGHWDFKRKKHNKLVTTVKKATQLYQNRSWVYCSLQRVRNGIFGWLKSENWRMGNSHMRMCGMNYYDRITSCCVCVKLQFCGAERMNFSPRRFTRKFRKFKGWKLLFWRDFYV